ncbi:MAG: hypothetical protein Q8R39_01575 [bacterium]|nr:hypothetical protein [bacterium]MDZ4284542.1 hypothetical protein [Patescibacteria group bacterium]
MQIRHTIVVLSLYGALGALAISSASAGEQGPFGAFKSRIRPDASEHVVRQGYLVLEEKNRRGGFGPAEVNVQQNHWGANNTWNDNRGSAMSSSTVVGNLDSMSVSGTGDGFILEVVDGATTQGNKDVQQESGVTTSVGGDASGTQSQQRAGAHDKKWK